jgi:hypothetical protein
MTTADLESAFQVYFRPLLEIRTSKCYFPVLHVVLSLPDICAALEDSQHEQSGQKYVDWCDTYLKSGNASGTDWWNLRCSLFHLGSGNPRPKGKHKPNHVSFSFVDPDSLAPGWHLHVTPGTGGSNLTIDVAQFADEMLAAVRRWFANLVQPANAQKAGYVASNLRHLVRVQPKKVSRLAVDPAGKVIVSEQRGHTTSTT